MFCFFLGLYFKFFGSGHSSLNLRLSETARFLTLGCFTASLPSLHLERGKLLQLAVFYGFLWAMYIHCVI